MTFCTLIYIYIYIVGVRFWREPAARCVRLITCRTCRHSRLSTSVSACGWRQGITMTIKKMRRPHVTANAPLHRPRVLGIAALAALCVYVIYQMTSSATDWYSDTVGGTTGAGGRCPAAEYVVTLARHATPDKVPADFSVFFISFICPVSTKD